MNAVPSNAVKMRKMKKEARLGASAVPMLAAQKTTEHTWLTWRSR